jgi:uncharacterized protein YcnI
LKAFHTLFLALAVSAGASLPVSAHVVLENGMSSWGSYYKAVFQVPHGCDGAATTGISIEIPEGVISVKPMEKSGWKLTTVNGKYAATYKIHGKSVTEGVKQVSWQGGSIADDRYDEFVFLTKLPEDKEIMRIYFPVTQSCGKVQVRWDQLPAMGSDKKLKYPAPALDLMAPHEGMEGHQH